MYLQHLHLINYRNYKNQEIHLNRGINILIGANGQGKTNLLEAVYYLSTGGNFRGNKDLELIQWGQPYFRLVGQMKKEGSEHVWLSMAPIPEEEIRTHFPNIYQRCLDEGYDATKEPIPVVPSQHYFMGGIDVDRFSKTSMERLYAAGETACNGVHGRNRLASNSLLESLVFAKRAAKHIAEGYTAISGDVELVINEAQYANYQEEYKRSVLDAIEKEKNSHE